MILRYYNSFKPYTIGWLFKITRNFHHRKLQYFNARGEWVDVPEVWEDTTNE